MSAKEVKGWSLRQNIYIYIYICNRNRVLGVESDCEMMRVDPCDDLKKALWEHGYGKIWLRKLHSA